MGVAPHVASVSVLPPARRSAGSAHLVPWGSIMGAPCRATHQTVLILSLIRNPYAVQEHMCKCLLLCCVAFGCRLHAQVMLSTFCWGMRRLDLLVVAFAASALAASALAA